MKRAFLLFFITIVLAACSTETIPFDYRFYGESEHWEAEFYFSGKEIWKKKDGRTSYNNEINDEFILTYKGALEELSSIRFLEYKYEMSAGGGGSIKELDKPLREVTFRHKGSGSGAMIRESEVIRVDVKWDDEEESFELHYTSK